MTQHDENRDKSGLQNEPVVKVRSRRLEVLAACMIFLTFQLWEVVMDRSYEPMFLFGAFGTTAATVMQLLVLRKQHAGRLPRWLWWVIAPVGVLLLLSWGTHAVARAEGRSWDDDDAFTAKYSVAPGDSSSRPRHISLLLCSADIIVYGIAPGPMRRFVGMEPDRNSFVSWASVVDRLPSDFAAYAALIDPSIASLSGTERDEALSRAFVLWQFPDHVLMVVLPDRESSTRTLWGCDYATKDQTVAYFSEDNRTGATGVYGVEPLAKELRNGDLGRLQSYVNLLKYMFISHDRTDLQWDPYFSFQRGQLDGLESKVDDLPDERRDFMRRKMGLSVN